jgi:hypothetical protein
MIKYIKQFLGIGEKPVAPTAPTPYKVEAPAVTAPVEAVKPAKKPAVKKATTAKPRKPKTTKS